MMKPETRSAIAAALAGSDVAGAGAVALGALAGGQRDPLLFRLAAARREREGDFAEAHRLLAAALDLAPGNADILTEIAAVWRQAGNPVEALKILDAMVGRGLDHAPTWLERGYALAARNQYRAANESYRRAAVADPASADALAGAAETELQLGHREEAEAFARRTLAIDPEHVVALHSLAQLDLDCRRFDAARDRLAPLCDQPRLSDPQRIQTLSLLGDALDGIGDTDAAFGAYQAAKTAYRALYAPQFGDARRGQTALIDHVRRGLQVADVEAWQRPIAPDGGGTARHIFLLGYPRSGTTLVENVLASLPGVAVLEEKPTLAATEPLLGAADGMAWIAAMDAAAADRYRSSYWSTAVSFGADVTGHAFVDMDPLKGISLPVIARLFPQARVIVMRRDPREVVWSCFRRNFHITPAAYEFSSLESAARHYDALMALTQECLDRLPIDAFILRYDRLVADFEGETRRLCAFAGLDWSPEVGNFAATAARRDVATASVRQVRQGLFDGTNQWRRYRDHLAPILPILQPWVERFGFED